MIRTDVPLRWPTLDMSRSLVQMLGYGEFIVKAVIDNPCMVLPSRLPDLQSSEAALLPFRQSGENRNLRMGHAIRDQDLFRFVS